MNTVLNSIKFRFFLGTGFGHNIQKEDGFKLFDKFYELGGRGIDTSLIYFNSEDILGEWISAHGIRDIIIHAKGGHHEDWCPRLDKDSILTDAQQTIDRLRVDNIAIFSIHRDDRDRPLEDILDTISTLIRQKLILNYGTSNWRIERIKSLIELAENSSIPKPILSSVNFSLPFPNFDIWPNVENCCSIYQREWYRSTQYPLLAWGCMGCGFLNEGIKKNTELYKRLSQVYTSIRNKERLRRIKIVSKLLDLSPAQVGWLWVCSQRLNIYPISGAHSISELEEILKISSLNLSFECCRWLNLEQEEMPKESAMLSQLNIDVT